MSPHRDGSYELLSVCVETLAGINAELSGIDLFFQQRNDTIFNGTFLLCLRIEHSYVVGGGEADNVQDSEWSCRGTRTNHPSSVDVLRRSYAAGPNAF